MKKLILVLMVVLVLGMIGKGMYSALAKFDANPDVATVYRPAVVYPCEVPDVLMEPCAANMLF